MTAAAAKADIGHNSKAVGELLEEQPELVFSEPGILAQLLESIEADIAKQTADVSTEKGRKALKSLAFGIAKRKTAIDAAGKNLNADLRKRIDVTDKVRREAWDKLEALQLKAKAPADAWDKKEDARKELVTEVRTIFANALTTTADATIAQIDVIASEVEHLLIPKETFIDLHDQAVSEQKAALEYLHNLKQRVIKADEDRRELERLRAEKAEAERLAAEKVAAEAKKKAEDERIAAVEKAAAERAEAEVRRKAEEAEKAAQAKRDAEAAEERRKAQAEIDEANRKAREAEEARLAAERKAQAEQVERDRQAAAEKARIAAEEAAAERRRKDQEHRSTVMRAAKEAMMEHGKVTEEQAKALVLAIGGGFIPNVSLEF